MARARAAWAELLADLAVVVRAFGALLRAETTARRPPRRPRSPTPWIGCASIGCGTPRSLLADPREHPDLWEVNGALVALVDRTLLELDADADVRRQHGPSELPVERQAAQLRKFLGSRRLIGDRFRTAHPMRIPGRTWVRKKRKSGRIPDERDHRTEASDAVPPPHPLDDP